VLPFLFFIVMTSESKAAAEELLQDEIRNQAEKTVVEILSSAEPMNDTVNSGDLRSGSGTLLKTKSEDESLYVLTNNHVYELACSGSRDAPVVADCDPSIVLYGDNNTLESVFFEPPQTAVLVARRPNEEEDIALLKLKKKRNLSSFGSSFFDISDSGSGNVAYLTGYPGSTSTLKDPDETYEFLKITVLPTDLPHRMRYEPIFSHNSTRDLDGMSGGPVMNLKGLIIGIHDEYIPNSQSFFGVPTSTICKTFVDLAGYCINKKENNNHNKPNLEFPPDKKPPRSEKKPDISPQLW
jgi:hypothetical protein